MQDPRGGQLQGFTHELKTIKGAQEWYENATADMLPIRVDGAKTSNGRIGYRVFDKQGNLLKSHG